MNKIKVSDLAKELNITENEVMKKLKDVGVEVKTKASTISQQDAAKIKNKKKEAAQPHIIRRNIKVINTDSGKSEIEQITTNISGGIKKSHQTLNENKTVEKPYSKEGLGVIAPRSYPNRNNVVVTRNGIAEDKNKENKVEDKVENKINDKIENVEKKSDIKSVEITNDKTNNSKENEVKSNNISNNSDAKLDNVQSDKPAYNNTQRPYNNNTQRPHNNTQGDRPAYNTQRPYNNNNNTQRPYNNTQGDRPAYNNQRPYNNNNNTQRPYNNTQGDRPAYNNGPRPYNNNNTQRPYNNTQGDRPAYNNGPRPYNNNNTQRPYNNTQGDRPAYNNGPRPYNRPYNNTPVNQVDKFIKQADTPIYTKETKDFSLTLIDKKKYNTQSTTPDNKKQGLNKNDLREKQTRVSTTKLKGLEVNSSGGMMDLYERDTDLFRKNNRRKNKRPVLKQTKIIPLTEVKLPESMSVKEFAEIIKKQASEVVKKLFALGILATVNQEIDFDTAFLIAGEFGITAEKQIVVTEEDILFDDTEDNEKDLVTRAPIVVIMGHVDHGKTSLLDKLRKTSVAEGEAGGITQHIGAYKIVVNKREICFLDTPGHEAFTAMRARGASITDIAIIVVAADDGIKPQTIEAIDHAKEAGVSIIVAINKTDKVGANVDKVKQELLEVGLVPEDWGGDTICVAISAKTGDGIDNLLEMVLLTADMKELKSNPKKQSKGTVIEARLDKNVGTITSLLVQRGTLNVGDTIVIGDIVGKVRAMKDDKGKKIKIAGPSTPVEIIGLSDVPETGDIFYEVENEKVAKQLVQKRKADARRNLVKQGTKLTLDDLYGQIKEEQIKDLKIIVKADVQGTLEALKSSLEKIGNDEVKVKVIHASTGSIKESDVTFASVSNAIIIGFNVKPDAIASSQAKKEKVDVRLYKVIYDAIEDVERAMRGMLAPTYKEVIIGSAEVRTLFKVSSIGTIAGSYVKSGKIIRNCNVRVFRGTEVIAEDKIITLKREKDDVKEVKEGYECGIKLETFNDIIEGDLIEAFQLVEEKKV